MKRWSSKDVIAVGLLGFLYIYLIFVFALRLSGDVLTDEAGIRGKEIMIFVVGILAGYISNEKINGKDKAL